MDWWLGWRRAGVAVDEDHAMGTRDCLSRFSAQELVLPATPGPGPAPAWTLKAVDFVTVAPVPRAQDACTAAHRAAQRLLRRRAARA